MSGVGGWKSRYLANIEKRTQTKHVESDKTNEKRVYSASECSQSIKKPKRAK